MFTKKEYTTLVRFCSALPFGIFLVTDPLVSTSLDFQVPHSMWEFDRMRKAAEMVLSLISIREKKPYPLFSGLYENDVQRLI